MPYLLLSTFLPTGPQGEQGKFSLDSGRENELGPGAEYSSGSLGMEAGVYEHPF